MHCCGSMKALRLHSKQTIESCVFLRNGHIRSDLQNFWTHRKPVSGSSTNTLHRVISTSDKAHIDLVIPNSLSLV